MNYQKIYNDIILNASIANRIKGSNVYYEEHHIIPKCLKGLNNKENLVLLTAKEHFICHKLLTYIYLNNRKIALAFHKMAFSKKYYNSSSRDYAYARELIHLIPISNETKEKMSKSHIGKSSGMKNKNHSIATKEKLKKVKSEITKEKIHNTLSGRTLSIEHKQNIGKAIKGRILSEEHKQNISKSKKGKIPAPFSEEHKFKISLNNGSKKNETKIKLSNAKKGKTWEEIWGVEGAYKRRNKNKLINV